MRNFTTSDSDENREYITGPKYVDLYAKTHALDIHQFRHTPENLRPRIGEINPKRAYGIAYDRILTALKYFEEEEANSETDVELQHAAQLLEKLYLNRPKDTPNRTKELHTAALAYYLAGYYARAFVLMRGVSSSGDSASNLMRLMFLRELSELRDITLKTLSQENFVDVLLANLVRQGDVDDESAVKLALEGTINRVYSLFYEYARIGSEDFMQRALAYARVGLRLSIEQNLSDWWWAFQCTIALLREYHRNSLWVCLNPLMEDDLLYFVERYIRAAFIRCPIPILELWRTQSQVVGHIKDGKSYCLKMPTSSGKTRIAELAILKFLVDTQEMPEKKCIYIAPYRALAAELEQSLRRSFEPIGVGVSQLYGSYDLNPAESLFIDQSKILIATPEKMDAFLRYNAEIAQQVGLIIVDEGHIIDPSERGLRFELFQHRYIMRYQRKGVRMLLISAVMPNVEQFAQWITGGETDAILTSDWRASQLLLGVLSWDGESSRVDYLYRDQDRVDQSFFISNYFTKFDPKELRAANCGRRLFPGKGASKSILTAMAAIKAIIEGPTLVFTPQKNNVQFIAEAIINVVQLQQQINRYFQRAENILGICADNDEKAYKLARCIQYAEEVTGENSIVVRSLKCGFVMHSGDVPRNLRIHLEELIREGILQLVVANTTLAQGVNLPVKTILIHSLYNNRKELDSRDFWNLCGRAGRAMCETEADVYIIADVSDSNNEAEDAKRLINKYVRQKNAGIIISSIRILLENMVKAWKEVFSPFSPVDIAELCDHLANDEERHWLTPELQRKLRVLDANLLALMQEQQLDIINPNEDLIRTITEYFKDSLLYIQISQDLSSDISSSDAINLIVERINHVARICKTKQRLQCYYSMALSIEGCLTIERLKPELVNYLQEASDFMGWSEERRASYVVKLCADFLLQIDDIRVSSENKEPPECWITILKQWLIGKTAAEIATNIELPDEWHDAMKIGTLVDELCEFRLPWGLNAISMFWKTSDSLIENQGEPQFIPPEVVDYFSSMLRFGVHDPVAAVALALGLDNRQAALMLSKLYEGSIDAVSILAWLQSLEREDVLVCTENLMIQRLLMEFISSVRLRRQFFLPFQKATRIEFLEVQAYLQEADVKEGMILLSRVENNEIYLYTPDIDYLGVLISRDNDLLRDLKSGAVSVTVMKVDQADGDMLLTLQIG